MLIEEKNFSLPLQEDCLSKIISYLDFFSLLAVEITSKYFQKLVTPSYYQWKERIMNLKSHIDFYGSNLERLRDKLQSLPPKEYVLRIYPYLPVSFIEKQLGTFCIS